MLVGVGQDDDVACGGLELLTAYGSDPAPTKLKAAMPVQFYGCCPLKEGRTLKLLVAAGL